MCAEPWKPKKGELLFERYDIIKKLGEGAWGTVYLAYDMKWDLRKPVAIKHLRPEIVQRTPRAIERFQQELKIIMDHLRGLPNVVIAYNFDNIDEENYFYIMDYIEGGSLQGLLDKRGVFPILDAIDVAFDICGALEPIHERNVIHNDLKPGNILIPAEGTRGLVMISDFGSASLKGSRGEVGTRTTGPDPLYYSSPELLKEEPVDERSDLYAVGVMLYEMIVGKVPFLYEEGVDWRSRILNDPPIVPSSRRKDVSSALDKLILKALKKNPDVRYQTAREMAEALKQTKQAQQEWEEELHQKTTALETYYAQGKRAYGEERWEEAVEALGKVVAIDVFYHDAASMLLDAQHRQKLQKPFDDTEELVHLQKLQKLFKESEELIYSEQWQMAWETLRKIHKAKNYHNVIVKEELFTRMFYVLGCQHMKAGEWYQAKQRFAKVLEYTLDYRDTKQQFYIARSNNRLKRNYEIKRSLGSGGNSQVDYAVDLHRGQRKVSLKRLTVTGDIEHKAAINRRFRIHAKRCKELLKHPNIVEIHDVEMRGLPGDEDVPVVVMEYIDGQNLAEFLEKTKGVPEVRAIELTCQLCDALQYAHQRGLLHLDIKPSNILIQTDHLKLTDFDHTSAGTGGYRSPEQVACSSKLDERTDIFAAGKVLCALLTGMLPIEDSLDEEDSSFQEITPALQAVIRKATAYDQENRYQSAGEMIKALEEAKAKLPPWRKFYPQVSSARKKIIEAATTWKGVLTIIGALLTIIIIPLLIETSAADPSTPLGMMREKVITYLFGTPTPIPRLIGETKFFVNSVMIEDITQPHYVTDTRQINIEVRAQDTYGETIPNDKISCKWAFDPPLQKRATGEESECKISYPTLEDLDSQVVRVTVQGKDDAEIAGASTNFIGIVLER